MSDRYSRFIILGQGRTGSTMLVQALNSHPQILCFGEIFNTGTARVQFDIEGYSADEASDLALRAADYDGFLRERIFCDQGQHLRAVGFKFHYDHFWMYEGMPKYFGDDVGLRVIHLSRRNRLRTFVSLKLAEQSGLWFEYAPEPSMGSRFRIRTLTKALRDPTKALAAVRRKVRPRSRPKHEVIARTVEISPEEFGVFCERFAYSEQHWAQLLGRHAIIDVNYEDLVADREGVVAEVERFLGVEPAPVEVTLRRQNPEPLRDLITNYDQLRAAFAGTEQAAFFEE